MSLRAHLSFVCCALLAYAASAGAQSQPTEFQRGWEAGVPATVTGEITALVGDDFDHGRADVKHFIRDAGTGQTFWVHYDREAAAPRSGSTVTLSGHATASELYVIAASSDANTPLLRTLAEVPSVSAVTGDQKTLVVIANFADTAVSCSSPAINDAMFSDPAGLSVDALYREMSFGNVSFSGETVGPYTIPFASSSACDPGAWASAADREATAAGINVAAYPHRVYVMPSSTCPATGYGTMSSTPSSAWIFACDMKGVFAHELGHNLGMDHASTPAMEYGDVTDVMTYGNSRLRPANAPHRHQMGWLAGAAIRLVDAGGVYYLAPLESDPVLAPSPQALAIRKPDTGDYYYLSFRHAQGFDNNIGGTYFDLVSVHQYKGDASALKTLLLAGLADGESFVDNANGVRVTMMGHDATRATVQIQFTPTCVAPIPSISVPASLPAGTVGTSVTFSGTVTNQDSSLCTASTFGLSTSVPTGWTSTTSPASVSLAPGQASDFTVTVASAPTASADTYALNVHATDSTVSSHHATASVSYALTSLCVAKAPILTASPLTQRGAPGATVTYSLQLTNTDGSGCGTSTFIVSPSIPTGLSGSSSLSSIALKPGAQGSFSVAVTPSSTTAAGNFSIAISAVDSVAASRGAAATVTYTIAVDDTSSPTAPAGLTASTQQKLKQIQLQWNPSTDNVAVAGYRVLRNGISIGVSSTTAWIDTAWVSGATYSYAIVAYDAAGNVSPASKALSVTLSGGGKGR